MNFTDESLQILAQQLGENSVSSRAELEAKVAPLLCLVLRTGQGRPSLVQWVQRALPRVAPASRLGRPVDPEWAAPRLARLLCSQLLQRIRTRRNTVAKPETIVTH
ncbi:MAG TPA: hypothetical protein VMG10_31225 [Gemmataceae bacterium]|nr:hypothetical protein [Gemmataceae bacterium]